jgi:hypothetical protein
MYLITQSAEDQRSVLFSPPAKLDQDGLHGVVATPTGQARELGVVDLDSLAAAS